MSLDIETTGVDGSARVIELGAIVVTSSGELAARCQTLIHQDADHLARPASLAAQRVHQIPTRQLLDPALPSEVEAAERFRRWLDQVADKYGALTCRAWNLPFERRFLSRPPWSLERWGTCLMAFAAAHTEGAKGGKLKLEEAARGLGLAGPQVAHRALADAVLAARVTCLLEQQIEEEAPCWRTSPARPQLPLLTPPESRSTSDLFSPSPSTLACAGTGEQLAGAVSRRVDPAPLPALPPEVQPSWRRRKYREEAPPVFTPSTPPKDADAEFRQNGCLWWVPQIWPYEPKDPATQPGVRLLLSGEPCTPTPIKL